MGTSFASDRLLVRQRLVLDEATSNIDMETEHALLRDLFSQDSLETLIMVTHRLPTALLADYVCDLGDSPNDPTLMTSTQFAASVDAPQVAGADEDIRKISEGPAANGAHRRASGS
jgi:ABC-type lipoprotein export system ATPase subunit